MNKEIEKEMQQVANEYNEAIAQIKAWNAKLEQAKGKMELLNKLKVEEKKDAKK